ncbi:hypothetical protein EVAR_65282_1 [Eumeta japonica]|uniref:(+)RNA virus helicase C-terminal domain-containing protein n=1 Tax=Eumeta variegata TaxID=151549 RepID=A0A4C1ZQT2_EUMVA|nr:hypothetical protein EVAR_65282_1 [Eumeta japonica]
MNHFGAIVMVLAGAKEVFLIGDVKQLPFVDILNLFAMECTLSNLVATVTKELLCTYRNPMDVAYAINERLTSKGTIIVRTMTKQKLHDRILHAVVAITHHTIKYVYYTDDNEHAVGRFIKRAMAGSENKIKENKAKIAIWNRDKALIDILMKR